MNAAVAEVLLVLVGVVSCLADADGCQYSGVPEVMLLPRSQSYPFSWTSSSDCADDCWVESASWYRSRLVMSLDCQQGWYLAPSHSSMVVKHQCNSVLSWFQDDSGKPIQGVVRTLVSMCKLEMLGVSWHGKNKIRTWVVLTVLILDCAASTINSM